MSLTLAATRYPARVGAAVTATVIAEWPKSVRENLRVSLDKFNGRDVVDIRCWYWTEAGELRPGRAGLTVSTCHLEQLAAALSEAVDVARQRGLIDRRTER